ncbi:MAG: Flp family type IVb pilin [Acidobacteriota bacterium]|jgi:Flp pilus assembly pilin Flp
MLALYTRIRNRFDDESGQTAVEYALMLVLVALAIAAASPSIGSAIANVFSVMAGKLVPPG